MRRLRAAVRKFPLAEKAYVLVTTRSRMIKTRRRVKALLATGAPVRLELGGGYVRSRNGMLNLDITNEADLFWDLRAGIPFPDASVTSIYASHLLEHLDYGQGQALLKECMRVLAPRGVISIAVPDARLYLEAYLGLRQLPTELALWEPAVHSSTAIDLANYVAYMGGEHRHMFDADHLQFVLRNAGFVEVASRRFDPALDLPERDVESIYAIGIRPAELRP